MNNDILQQVDRIVEQIENSQEYQDYQKLKEKMNQNEKIKTRIESIKKLQQEIVKKEYKNLSSQNLEKELKELEKELMDIPLYRDFLEIQENLNQQYLYIKERLQSYFDQRINPSE